MATVERTIRRFNRPQSISRERMDKRKKIGSRDLIKRNNYGIQNLKLLISDSRLKVRDIKQSLEKSMHIDRKLSSVILVIERIYLPKTQDTGTSLSLRNQIDTEIHFSPDFFINLIQITGNLVANAFKMTASNGSVNVVYTLDDDEGHRGKLNMTITYSGKSIPHDLVAAFSEGKKIEKPKKADGEPCFAERLHHVMQIVSKEEGRIFMENESDSVTTFSLAFPIPDKYLNQRTGFYPIVKNGEVFVNGS